MAESAAEDHWVVGVAEVGDDLWLLRVASLPEHRHGFAYRLRLQVRFESERADGMPTGAVADRLGQFEDGLDDDRALLLMVATSARTRRYLLYASDEGWAEEWAVSLATANPDLRIGHQVANDPEWDSYELFLRKGRDANGDRLVLDRLRSQGADLSQPRVIRYFLYFPDQDHAREAQRVLIDHEYEVEVGQHQTTGEWTVIASHHERAVAGIIARMRNMLSNFAADHDGTFDGWEAAVEAD